MANVGRGSAFWSSDDHLELSMQPIPGFESHIAVEAVGEMLHRNDALMQDGNLVVWLYARHAVGRKAFA